MQTYPVTLHFDSYIAHPYWPEQEKLINITKESGMNRARSDEKRIKALRDYLAARGMTMEDFEALERRANRQFYTFGDTLPDGFGLPQDRDAAEICVPAHQMYGCLAQAADLASTSIRVARLDQIRTVLRVSNIATGQHQASGVWERFVLVKSGTGQTLSNQRALRVNQYLKSFVGEGFVAFNDDAIALKKVVDFLSYAGREIGAGASRKMGWGRFTVRIGDAIDMPQPNPVEALEQRRERKRA